MPHKIVLAEDDPFILQLLDHMLTARGYQVIATPDGEEALAAVRRERPALLITDVMMPRKNGYQLVHALMNDDQETPAPKIIILTSRTDPADIKRGLTVGADVFIPKPFDVQDLAFEVQQLLDRKNA
jgi:two-component system, OmpR family, response regulator MprA